MIKSGSIKEKYGVHEKRCTRREKGYSDGAGQ